MGCFTRRPPFAALAVLALAMALPAAASARTIYDTTRIIGYTQNECIGQKPWHCITVASQRTWVDVDSTANIVVSCLKEYPYIVGWDARHHEHISLAALSRRPSSGAGADRLPQRLNIAALNNAGAPGFVRIFAGCSKKPYAGTPILSGRSAIPSKHPGVTR
jgi:hypothetical protein